METTRYQLPSGEIVDVDATAAKGALVIGFTLKGGQVVEAKRVQPPEPMIRHRYNVWVDVPAQSVDGWSKYPDYSADEIGRMVRRALHDYSALTVVVEHADSAPLTGKE